MRAWLFAACVEIAKAGSDDGRSTKIHGCIGHCCEPPWSKIDTNYTIYALKCQHEKDHLGYLMRISPAQCRAARAMLEWSRDRLAVAAKVARRTVVDFERGARSPYDRTLADIQHALEVAGIEFTNSDAPGIRLKRSHCDSG